MTQRTVGATLVHLLQKVERHLGCQLTKNSSKHVYLFKLRVLYFNRCLCRTQIINEGMLEDVNNILNSGDVPNLYGPEEMERIMTACRPICVKKRIAATKLNVFAQVLTR